MSVNAIWLCGPATYTLNIGCLEDQQPAAESPYQSRRHEAKALIGEDNHAGTDTAFPGAGRDRGACFGLCAGMAHHQTGRALPARRIDRRQQQDKN